jgi:CHAT domain-containing protein/Tfp pilus assembly protein PilF
MELHVLNIPTFLIALGTIAMSCAAGQTPAAMARQAGKLDVRQSIDRQLGPAQTDVFTVDAAAGQFLHIVVEKKGVDVAAALLDPSGKAVVKMDGPGGASGSMPASLIAARSGAYKVQVSKSPRSGETGRYSIELTELQTPTDQDRTRLKAEKQFLAALAKAQNRQTDVLDEYDQAQALWHSLGDTRAEALCLYQVGIVHAAIGEKEAARNRFNQALALWRAQADPLGEARTLVAMAGTYSEPTDAPRRRLYLNQAAESFRLGGDQADEADIFMLMAASDALLGEVERARDAYNQALPLLHAVGDQSAIARTLNDLGAVYFSQGENTKALDSVNEALASYRKAGNKSGQATALGNLGSVLSRTGQTQKALASYNEALVLIRVLGGASESARESTVLLEIAKLYKDQGDEKKASQYRDQARALDPAADTATTNSTFDQPSTPASLIEQGQEDLARDNRPAATKAFTQAVNLSNATGSRAVEAQTLEQIGIVFYKRGEMPTALSLYSQALPLYRAAGNRAGEAVTLHNIGSLYLCTIGETHKSVDYFNQELALSRTLGDRAGEARSLQNLGVVNKLEGRTQEALDEYKQALDVWRALNDRAGQGTVLMFIGHLYSALQEQRMAARYYNQALALIGGSANVGNAQTRSWLGRAYADLGEKAGALGNYTQALSLARELSNPAIQGDTLGNLMDYWAGEANSGLAIFFGKQAVNQFQNMRRNIAGLDQETRDSYLNLVSKNYRKLADLLIAQGRLSEAEQVLALLKEQEFYDYVRRDSAQTPVNGGASLTTQEAEADRRSREILDNLAPLGTEHRTLITKSVRTDQETRRLVEIEKDLQRGNQAFKKYLDQLPMQFSAKPTSVSELREDAGLMADLSELPPGTVMIFALVADDRIREILRTPDIQKAYEYPIRVEDLNRKVQSFRDAVQDPHADPRPIAEELYKILIGPMEKDLRAAKAKTLMWSLDGTLRYLPLAALYDGKRYLIEDFRVSVMTLATRSRMKDHPDPEWKAAGFGVTKAFEGAPALPSVPAELAGIIATKPGDRGVLAGEVKLDGDFTRDAMHDTLLKGYPVVHIATHFRFEPGNVAQSFLLLGDGGHFSLADLETSVPLFGGVQLLTLSACNTGVGDGAEVEGFGTLAQQQGAKAVIASLWPVADESTSRLMQEFYRIRESSPGLSKLEALQRAQLELLNGVVRAEPVGAADRGVRPPGEGQQTTSYTHPYFWAPFFLMGNWL